MFFSLSSTISPSHPAREQDVRSLKNALSLATEFRTRPGTNPGMTEEAMFDAVRQFQKDNGLRADGIIRPGGPTQRMLNSRLRQLPEASIPAPTPQTTNTPLFQDNAAPVPQASQQGGGFLQNLLNNATTAFAEARAASNNEPRFQNLSSSPPDDGSRPLPPEDDGGNGEEEDTLPEGDDVAPDEEDTPPDEKSPEEEKPKEKEPEEEECPLELIRLGNQYRRELDEAQAKESQLRQQIDRLVQELERMNAEARRLEFLIRLEAMRARQRGRFPRIRKAEDLIKLQAKIREQKEKIDRLSKERDAAEQDVIEANALLQEVFEEASKYERCDGLIGLPSE